ncbi:hypothetical protein [Kushneria phosphatilytica]|uniref:hypothetical protein n=1 Tax=Kushneria phosphatilytica TaxID=657387 RepID=UPI003B8482DA
MIPGPAEIISDGGSGFLVHQGDTNAFAQQLMGLILDSELRIRFSRSARDSVAQFTSDVIVVQWQEYLESLVSVK